MKSERTVRLLAGFFLLATAQGFAGVLGLDISSREPILDGKAFGKYGSYEKISGTVRFGWDPAIAANQRIVDLDKAPLGESGLVEAVANFMVLQPLDAKLRRGLAFLEVSNRGGKAAMRYFNAATAYSDDPATAAEFGDGLLMNQGLTVIWVGWQYDIPNEGERLRLEAPRAGNAESPITGWVRSDWVVDEAKAVLSLGHRRLPTFYPAIETSLAKQQLTERNGRTAARKIIPPDQWRFVGIKNDLVVSGATHISKVGGFAAGKIYEMVYQSRHPAVSGLGLVAIRDMIAYAKHDPASPFPVEQGLGFGVSQTGRFLRHFLYQGFNVDESGRRAFDGLLIHSAGAGRGSFNHRFAQPSRDAHRYSAFFYPTDLFPFATEPLAHPASGNKQSLLGIYADKNMIPKIMTTNTSYEYWGRAAALVHTSLDGQRDTRLHDNERIYHLASAQHFVERLPFSEDKNMAEGIWRGNPLDFLVNLRALAVRLADWVDKGLTPPDSRYPLVSTQELVPVTELAFPKIANLNTPNVVHSAYLAAYGQRWEKGVVDVQPPSLGQEILPLVPRVDETGNSVGGVMNTEIMVPLASYIPWNLRQGLASPEELSDFRGTLVALPLTDSAARNTGDPRQSIESRYKNRKNYLQKVATAASDLVGKGFLLGQDQARVMERAEAYWDWLVCGEWRGVETELYQSRACG